MAAANSGTGVDAGSVAGLGGEAEPSLVDRVRVILAGPGISEKRMFGGLCFLIDGNMVAGTSSQRGLLLRIGRANYAAALARPGTRPMDMRGRPLEGNIYLDHAGLSDDDLAGWIAGAEAFVRTLPAKAAAEKQTRRRSKRT